MRFVFLASLLLAAQALALFVLGQPPLAESGQVLLWANEPLSPDNSQHIADWYMLSHIIHGLLFYLALWYFFPRLPLYTRLLLALGLEISWEVIENTPWLIDHYRQQALAVGYSGDSILNSLMDTLAMAVGFAAAWRLPVWGSIVAALVLEGAALFAIRDSLALNVLGLLYQFDFITAWQMGG